LPEETGSNYVRVRNSKAHKVVDEYQGVFATNRQGTERYNVGVIENRRFVPAGKIIVREKKTFLQLDSLSSREDAE